MAENSCYTYFKIVGDFDPDVVTAMLGLQPEKYWRVGDLRQNGTKYDFALWEYGRCADYDVFVENQMYTTIEPLLRKADVLNRIRNEYDVAFYLEIVPTIYVGNQNPCLAPSLKVIDFCHITRTEIDIDMCVMDSEE